MQTPFTTQIRDFYDGKLDEHDDFLTRLSQQVGDGLWSAITPAALPVGSTNDYNPTGLSTANLIYQDVASGGSTLTGLAAQLSGFTITIINTSSTDSLTVAHNSSSSLAANRIYLPNGIDLVLEPGNAVRLVRGSSFWRGVSTTGGASSIASDAPYVDLRLSPYSVVANDATAASANTTGIRAAIAAYSGTKARLVLPRGIIYVKRDTAAGNAAIKFSGVTDLTFAGQGMHATRIVVDDVSFGGDWHGISIDGSQRIQICDLGIEQGSDLGVDGQQHHGIYITSVSGTTRDIYVTDVYFGQHGLLADAFRVFGTSVIYNVKLLRFLMKLDGLGAGARSGIAIQRNYSELEIGHGHIRGAKNQPLDMEATGASTSMDYAYVHDLILDNSLGQTSVAASFSGVSNGARATNMRVTNVACIAGRAIILSTDNLYVDKLTIYASAAWAADTASANLQVSQINNGLVLRDVALVRTGTAAAGNLLDCQNSGDSTRILGGLYQNDTQGYPIYADGCGNLTISGTPRVIYGGSSPTTRGGVFVSAVARNADNLKVDGLFVSCTSGTLRSALDIQGRTPRSMVNINLANVECNSQCTYGAYFSRGAGSTYDATPIVTGLQGYVTAPWKQVDESDNPITSIFPCISGIPNQVGTYVGETSPEGALAAKSGSTCFTTGGASYFKGIGTGSAGWTDTTPALSSTDPTSGKGVPLTLAQWAAVTAKVPSYAWGFQDASGTISAKIGTGLTTYLSPTYQQSVTGWARSALRITDNTTNQRATFSAGTGPNPATGSVAWFGYINLPSTPSGTRILLMASDGATLLQVRLTTTPRLQINCAGTTTNGVNNPTGVRPMLLVYDKTATTVKLYTDQEIITGVYSAGVVDGNKGYGAAGAPPTMDVLLGAAFSGANAEFTDALARTMFTNLGYAVPW